MCGIRKGEYKRCINGGNELSEGTTQVLERLKYLPFTLGLVPVLGELGKSGGCLSLTLGKTFEPAEHDTKHVLHVNAWNARHPLAGSNSFMNFCFLNPVTFISAVKARSRGQLNLSYIHEILFNAP